MKAKIVPALLSEKLRDFRKKIERLKKEYKEKNLLVQIDICDGAFVPSKTIIWKGCQKDIKKTLEITQDYQIELDLMIDLSDSKKIDKWIKKISLFQAKRIIFHLNSVTDWDYLFKKIKEYKIKSKFGLGVQTKHQCKKEILPVLEKYNFSYVQFMGIEKIGYGGQSFSSKVLRKIKKLRQLKPEIEIQVDGGVKNTNAKKIIEAGANNLVVGSGIFGAENLKERIDNFLK